MVESPGASIKTGTRIKVLCFDGGGVRGYSSLLILKAIWECLPDEDKSRSPSQLFDLICGTSTGGLIALMLGRLNLTVDAALVHYENLAPIIFGTRLPRIRAAVGRPMYHTAHFERGVKNIIEEVEGDPEAPLKNQNGCRTFVVATAAVSCRRRILRTYASPPLPRDDCPIWRAARATSAAPIYFQPVKIGAETLIDGGMSGANNPSFVALLESKRIFPNSDIGCFVSIGTGMLRAVPVGKGIFSVFMALMAKHLDSEETHDCMQRIFSIHSNHQSYFRFNPNEEVGKFRLDDHTALQETVAHVRHYISMNTTQIEDCARALATGGTNPQLQ